MVDFIDRSLMNLGNVVRLDKLQIKKKFLKIK